MQTEYTNFLASKRTIVEPSGFEVAPNQLRSHLFAYQADITRWALRLGRAALFLDTGMGKTAILLEWAAQVIAHHQTNTTILVLAPLAVSRQIVREGGKFGIAVHNCRSQDDVIPDAINVTNYERLHLFNPDTFRAVVLDEGSILKAKDGKTRNTILEMFSQTPYKLICTATPSPNDYMELGTYAQFLGVMSYVEMLATYFCHDGGETSKWRLKGHAEVEFWKWLASWSVAMRKPSDLGYSDTGHVLPPKERKHVVVTTDMPMEGYLFAMEARSLTERRNVRKASVTDRVAAAASIVNTLPADEKVIVWCNLNDEGDRLTTAIDGAVQVAGADTPEHKETTLIAFTDGTLNRLVTKPDIAGFGLNMQACRYMVFVGLSDSFESLYQAERRIWRYGQMRDVTIWIVTSDLEGAVVANIAAKEHRHHQMMDSLVVHMQASMESAIRGTTRQTIAYNPTTPMVLPSFCVPLFNGVN